MDIRLKGYRTDVKFHRVSIAIVLHIEKRSHLPDWDTTRILEKHVKKQTRKTLKAAHIISRNTFSSRSGFITWSAAAAKLAASWIKHVVVRVIYSKNSRRFLKCFILDVCHFIFRSDQGSLQPKALWFLKIYCIVLYCIVLYCITFKGDPQISWRLMPIIDLCITSFLSSVIYRIIVLYKSVSFRDDSKNLALPMIPKLLLNWINDW